MFRNEGSGKASQMILEAIAATLSIWDPPELGIVTFVDPSKVDGVPVRGSRVFGHCYSRAGFSHVGFTAGGLWAWQMLPDQMPEPMIPLDSQIEMPLNL